MKVVGGEVVKEPMAGHERLQCRYKGLPWLRIKGTGAELGPLWRRHSIRKSAVR